MKKLISVMLVLCMVLALIPAMAFAATPEDAVAMVGEGNYYNDLQAAIDAASAPGAATNRVDIVASKEVTGLVISGNVVLQLNGHTLTGATGSYVHYPVEIVGSAGCLTIQGPGTLNSDKNASTTVPVLANAGKLILQNCVKINGVIVNTGDVTKKDADLNGYFDNKGTVTVNDGIINVPTNHAAFENTGKATVNGGRIYGRLDQYDEYHKGKASSHPGLTVNGGAFNDYHVLLHATAPVAGVQGGTIPGTADKLATDPSIGGFKEYWVSSQSIETYAKYYNNKGLYGDVVFLAGDAKVSGMPSYGQGWTYKDAWDSYYDDYEDKDITLYADADPYDPYQSLDPYDFACDGRGLVNNRSDLNITASKYTKINSGSGNKIADSVLNKNAQYVESVKAVCTGVNKNEVFYNIEITADLDKLIEFGVPEDFNGWGNKNGTHQWIPITLRFTDLDGNQVAANSDVICRDAWNSAFLYQTSATDNDFHLWIGVDHVLLGSNSSWDFADMRYAVRDHGLIYRCTIVVKDKDGNVPENSEPDDTTGAAVIPSGSGSSTPAATTKPAGTGAGDGPAKTGDNSTVMLWATLLVASAAGVAICVVDEAKKRSRK